MNIPNSLTLARIILAFIFMALLFMKGAAFKVAALSTFVIAAATDYLDGYIAKKFNMATDFGRLMDPVADKVLTLAAFMAFVELEIIPAWMVLIVIVREMAITGLRIANALKRSEILPAENQGKHKTVSQVFTIFFILIFLVLKAFGDSGAEFWTPELERNLRLVIIALMSVTVAFTVSSGVNYVANNKKYLLRDKRG
jgi:CDP-diacylglycerol--glycerol-3-phosphate 3-phosphatidyltransferase